MKLNSEKYITPCFIFDKDEFERGINLFKSALNHKFSSNIIGYSVKTNSLPYCLCLARDLGCYAEVVSHDEYELALLCGYAKNHIIYNGPMKSKETFLDAIINGAIVNIETNREINWLQELPDDNIYNIGIRVNVDISDISPEDAKDNDSFSRFGFCSESNDLNIAISEINKLKNIKLSGIHIHRTSKTRSISFYSHLIKYACKIISDYCLELDYIDIGGGYYGIFPNCPTFDDYVFSFYEEIKKHEKLKNRTIIVEPGNALTASAFSYLSTVIDTKTLENTHIITTDGSRNDIDPLFAKSNYLKEIIYNTKSNSIINEQVICGATCLEFDKLFTIKDACKLNIGDNILYNNVGAYTMCLSPLFINYFPRVYLKNDQNPILIRDKWEAKDYITKSKLI